MKVSTTQFAKLLARQRALTDADWLLRCDELAEQQRILFLELVTFSRDGLPDQQSRCLVDFLSTLQFVSSAISNSASDPVKLPEFQAAIKRAMQYFHALTTDDKAHFARMVQTWHDSTVSRSEPVIWAGCIETLRQPGILEHSLGKDIVVTLYAIADVFSRRVSGTSSD